MAVAALFHSTERRRGGRDIQRVDADHARIERVGELGRRPDRRREYVAREPERQSVCAFDDFRQIGEYGNRNNWTKRLFVHDLETIVDTGHDSRVEEESGPAASSSARDLPAS